MAGCLAEQMDFHWVVKMAKRRAVTMAGHWAWRMAFCWDMLMGEKRVDYLARLKVMS